jgi:PKD repeat protein
MTIVLDRHGAMNPHCRVGGPGLQALAGGAASRGVSDSPLRLKEKRSARQAWCIGLVGLLAVCTAFGQSANQITGVSPATAAQGTTLTVTFTLDTDSPPAPPAGILPTNVSLGTMVGSNVTHASQYTVTAAFNIPASAPVGYKDASIVLPTPNGTLTFSKASAFQVTAGSGVAAAFSGAPTSGTVPMMVNFTNSSTGPITNQLWSFGDGATSTVANPSHTYTNTGTFTVSLTVFAAVGSNTLTRAGYISVTAAPSPGGYVVVDTGQTRCYNNTTTITAPAPGQPFYGQDAQCLGAQPSFTLSSDGLTVYDRNTGLTWQRSPESTGDGIINASDKFTWANAQLRPAALNAAHFGGFSDWRLPTIKELYSLIDFRGTDPSGLSGTDTSGLTPFIDTNYFQFAYGDTSAGERIIDSQYASSTLYVSTVAGASLFGVNFADGRIKGYGLAAPGGGDKTFFVQCVRGNPSYGLNFFVDNGDQTIGDQATGLMWTKADSGAGMNWSNALAWVQAKNATQYLGHNDWRLPNAKELQSILDYTRSPDTTASAAIDPIFSCTQITNEDYQADYPWYWSGTTHAQYNGSGASGAYVCFGRGMGYMNSSWVDVHGAGCQRSDPKGSLSGYTQRDNGYYNSIAPQGDAVRCSNYVRLVRDIPATKAWRFAFVGDTHTPLSTIPSEIASAVVNDGVRLMIVAGDLVEVGTGSSPNVLANRLAAWSNAFVSVSAAGIPIYALRGNHENDVTDNLGIWNSFFAMPGNGPSGETNLTYSFATNNALFIGLDDYVNIHRVNQLWLGRQLGLNQQPHLFVFGHEPAFKAFHTDGLDDYPTERNAFWNSLAAAGAKVYLCGHDHFYNVARIDDGDGNPANDLYQFIVGTGGSTNWPVNRYNYDGTNGPFTPVNVASVTNTYGYLLVEISGPGSNDLDVSLTWKQRTYNSATASYVYLATNTTLIYTAVNRYQDSVGDCISDWWRARYFGGTGTTTNSQSCAGCDPDHDGADNYHEYLADTDPTNALSFFRILSISNTPTVSVTFLSSANRTYTLFFTTNLASGVWSNVPSQTDIPGTGQVEALADPSPGGGSRFYRVGVRVP